MPDFGDFLATLGGGLFKQLGKLATNDGGLEDFSYDLLPEEPAIRLLQVKDVKGMQITVSLETFPLDKAPPYHALSYTWGTPFSQPNFEDSTAKKALGPMLSKPYEGNQFLKIKCNDKRLRIGMNLFEALCQLSVEEMRDVVKHRYLWVDAICIDQNDDTEKGRQILLMGRIYAKAATVVVWLGKPLDNTEPGLRALEKLSKLSWEQLEVMQGKLISEKETYEALGIDHVTDEEWSAFVGISRRGWFKRVWVVQETIFATSLFYVLGRNRLGNGEILSRVSKLLVLSGWSTQILEPYLTQLPNLSGPQPGSVAALYQMKEDLATPGKLKPTQILVSMRSREASRRHDYVFAMLNVLALALRVEPQNLPIKPDYSQELSQILEVATLLCIEADKNLTVLSAVQDRTFRTVAEGASWTVDWTVEMSPYPLSMLHRGEAVWKPSGSMSLEEPKTTTEHVLKFRAAHFCSIAVIDTSAGASSAIPSTEQLDIAVSVAGRHRGPRSQGLTEVLWRTLLSDTVAGRSPAPVKAGQSFVYSLIAAVIMQCAGDKDASDSKIAELIGKLEQLREKDPYTVFPNDERVSEIAEALISDDPINYMDLLEHVQFTAQDSAQSLTRRRFALMSNDYFGLVPASAKQGDRIYVVPGMTTPFVFRPAADGQYELLGEAYVHGIMSGEFAGKLDYKLIALQ